MLLRIDQERRAVESEAGRTVRLAALEDLLPVIGERLAAENSKSVTRQFFGRQGKTIGLGISSYTNIEPFEIPILDASGPIVFSGWNGQLSVRKDVARVKGGIPNPKTRPVLALPWSVAFEVQYQENTYCTLENLRQAFAMGGTLGLGTFRPYFGRYELTGWSY